MKDTNDWKNLNVLMSDEKKFFYGNGSGDLKTHYMQKKSLNFYFWGWETSPSDIRLFGNPQVQEKTKKSTTFFRF